MIKDGWEEVECNICRRTDHKILYKANYDPELVEGHFSQYSVHENIVKCNNCGLVYESPRERADILDRRLAAESYPLKESSVEERLQSFDLYIKSLKKNIPARGRLLDIGCNIGDFMHLIRREGLDVCGIEPSLSAAEKARKDFGLEVINDTADNAISAFPDDFFDIITMWDVIEHFSDPRGILDKINKKLRKTGCMCIATHNIDSLFAKLTGSCYPHLMYQHFYHFSDRTLKAILDKTGFEIVEIEIFNKKWSTGYLISLLKEFFPKSKFIRHASNTLTAIFRFLRLQKIMVTVPLYNDMRIYARKKA